MRVSARKQVAALAAVAPLVPRATVKYRVEKILGAYPRVSTAQLEEARQLGNEPKAGLREDVQWYLRKAKSAGRHLLDAQSQSRQPSRRDRVSLMAFAIAEVVVAPGARLKALALAQDRSSAWGATPATHGIKTAFNFLGNATAWPRPLRCYDQWISVATEQHAEIVRLAELALARACFEHPSQQAGGHQAPRGSRHGDAHFIATRFPNERPNGDSDRARELAELLPHNSIARRCIELEFFPPRQFGREASYLRAWDALVRDVFAANPSQ